MPKQICEIGASSWFNYKEICLDVPITVWPFKQLKI